MRQRMLAAQGLTAIGIPAWQWEALATPAQQRSYLARKLRPHLKLPAAVEATGRRQPA